MNGNQRKVGIFCVVFLFLITGMNAFGSGNGESSNGGLNESARDMFVGATIQQCTSYLSKPLPNEAQSSGEDGRFFITAYPPFEKTILFVDGGIVVGSRVDYVQGASGSFNNWFLSFLNYFKENKWNKSDLSESYIYVYRKDNIYAAFYASVRDTSDPVMMINFFDDLSLVKDYIDIFRAIYSD